MGLGVDCGPGEVEMELVRLNWRCGGRRGVTRGVRLVVLLSVEPSRVSGEVLTTHGMFGSTIRKGKSCRVKKYASLFYLYISFL